MCACVCATGNNIAPELLPFIRRSNINFSNKFTLGGLVKSESKASWRLLRDVGVSGGAPDGECQPISQSLSQSGSQSVSQSLS